MPGAAGLRDVRPLLLLTPDAALKAEPWASALGRYGIALVHLAGCELLEGVAVADLVLLSATELCTPDLVRALRERSRTPLLIAVPSGRERSAVEALQAGADSFLPLPCSRAALVAQVEALCGRAPGGLRSRILDVGDLHLDVGRHEVTMSGRAMAVPPQEFALLRLLMDRAGEVVSSEQLHELLWGEHPAADAGNALAVLVRRLRRRLEADPAHPTLLETVRGLGYRLRDDLPSACSRDQQTSVLERVNPSRS